MVQDLSSQQPLVSDLKTNWYSVLKKLNQEYGNEIYNSWIKNLKLKNLEGETLIFSVPSKFIRDWITAHYVDKIIFFLEEENHSIRRVKIIVEAVITTGQNNLKSDLFIEKNRQTKSVSYTQQSDDWPLDERFTFDKFVIGHSNELAYASAKRMAQNEKFDFNPLFIYGGVGLGKTHLMHSIAWEIKKFLRHLVHSCEKTKVLYLSAERFMFQFIKSLRQKDTMSFKQKFRSVDVLIIDDIQFMIGKNSTQEEFFHTFNSLLDLNKKVIISSDRAPSDLESFDDRIKSRLSWGLVADIMPADFDLRYKILEKKSFELNNKYENKINIPRDVMVFLAKTIANNVRELEGALNKVVTFSNLMKREIGIELAQTVLKDLLRSSNRRITIDEIQSKVANYFNIKVDDLISSKRIRSFARPRQIAMYLAKKLTSRSLPEIGRKFGGRDHTTVIHAVKKVDQLKIESNKFDEDINVLTQIITSS